MRIYFSGIGGSAIGPLARIAKDTGHEVLGSDEKQTLETKELEKIGIKIYYNQDGESLKDEFEKQKIDCFIRSKAISNKNPEFKMAKRLKIKTAKRDYLLSKIIKLSKQKLIAVAGTHGKTTTTSMLIWAFKELGIKVSYSVGTTLKFAPSGVFEKDAEYFIYECDEYDKNFLHFHPHKSLITTIDYDHSDTYPSITEYKDAFSMFINQSKQTFIYREDFSYLKENREIEIHDTIVSLLDRTDESIKNIGLLGKVYRQNALLVFALIKNILPNVKDANLLKIINSYPGSNRRFEKITDNIYSDYAHHPAEIKATIEIAKELNKPINVVYQPFQNLRQYDIKQEYAHCFDGINNLFWLDTYLARESKRKKIIEKEDLAKEVKTKLNLKTAELDNNLAEEILNLAKTETVVLIGAGSIDNWARENFIKEPPKILKLLKSKY